ncbi:uncharacterized protein J4E87_008963 [Alternaria ethzedia]|uniref:uncharacterized protein n=1 Tax=Alternaria ethzedia TaxID=181014 RepID=UPI0020C4615C|nr:uncharacterized protein J4E87_008963 [Alternaria ethzedia]XP_051294746.1 uncharacterized protein J4E90_002028 [Alternaria incomplexa]XP_051306309.1 uncharacterized protein J4E86_002158 [Alternaria arbusti]XP_051356509.1 uncharacterized protein J4E92_001869 [Alternaria infectoria]KAI4714951.1 hypothetical protein J4E89_000634 [Alternaria sp. Ai002NY15]KAI4615507.1 hypothetical protein J4E87_008963 [Alternaria ethzedia]KAI4919891.1 hypothetical protein J4E90_002028 [Alternaria incomplexa]KA
MGGRLSMPKAADGMSETSKPTSANARARLSRGGGIINGRTVMAPLAALTMAGLLFVYARTSIRAAKLNAKKHREADGGQISWHKESMRRHGQMDRLDDDRGTFSEALMGDIRKKKQQKVEENQKAPVERSENDAELRKIMGKKD